MPTSLADFLAAKATAGAAYATAAKAVTDAWVELSALDTTLANGFVSGSPLITDTPTVAPTSWAPLSGINTPNDKVRSFNSAPTLPYHLPFIDIGSSDLGARAVDRAKARALALLATYGSRIDVAGGSALVTEQAARAAARASLAALRVTAGATYATAATTLVAAFVELAALDRTLESGFVGGGQQTCFSGPLQMPLHAEFMPTAPNRAPDWLSQIDTRLHQLLATAPSW